MFPSFPVNAHARLLNAIVGVLFLLWALRLLVVHWAFRLFGGAGECGVLAQLLSEKQIPVVWVLVASAGGVFLYTLQKNIHERPSIWTRKNPLVAQDLRIELLPVSGVAFAPEVVPIRDGTSLEHMTTPYADLRERSREHTARGVASRLAGALSAGTFDHLILVAPPRFMAELKACLSDSVRARVLAEIPKGFARKSGVDEKALLSHIEAAFPVRKVL